MKIGGFIKQSLIDFPGKIASVIFTTGCNFRCFYCHNPELVLPELIRQSPQFDYHEIINYLFNNRFLLDAVVITGGEPTIYEGLPELLSKIKRLGLLVKLDTNGTNSQMIHQLIKEKLVDYIAMDIKTTLELNKYKQVVGDKFCDKDLNEILKTISIIKNSDGDFEFRTTIVGSVHSKNDIQKMINSLFGKYYLQNLRLDKTLTTNLKEENLFSDIILDNFVISNQLIEVIKR